MGKSFQENLGLISRSFIHVTTLTQLTNFFETHFPKFDENIILHTWVYHQTPRKTFFLKSLRNQFRSVTQSCLTLCSLMDCSLLGFPVHHQLLELAQIHVHRVSPWCHPTISSSVTPFCSCLQSFPASGLFKWVGSSHQVAKVLAFQL